MKYFVNSREMKQYDANTTEYFQIPALVLMERAATAFVEELLQRKINLARVLLVCGTGNNGGDGLAIARLLRLEGYKADIVLAGAKEKASAQNKKQQEICKAYQYEILSEIPPEKEYTVVIDAVFGVGLAGNIEGTFFELLAQMNELSGTKIAVDVPSGISADNGAILGIAFRADITITFSYAKTGMLLWPGNEYTGKIITRRIGIGTESWLGKTPRVAALEESDILKLLPPRKRHSNKGSYGKLLVVAGSTTMAGAACLCGRAAYATGCGLVRVVTPEENREIIQNSLPEAILTTYPKQKNDLTFLIEAMKWADGIVCGPGIGTDKMAELMVECVLKNAAVPVLMDADALNIIAKDTSVLLKPHTELIVTPHMGEMSRLTGDSISYIQTELLEVAEEFARQYNVVCVLKDERTVVSVPYGQTFLNLSGNNGMATAGSGDVLSGMIGSLFVQKARPKDAAVLGVFLHGKAGDCAREEAGTYGMMASDIIDGIRFVWKECTLEKERK